MIAAKQSKADTEEVAPDKPEPRRMLNEAQVLALIPVSRTTPHRMTKTGRFPKGTYARTAGFGLRMRSSLGRTRLMNSIRTVAGASGGATASPSPS
jgi:hypothetical protein